MNSGQSLFAQLMDHLPSHEFRQCVQRYAGNFRVRSFSCWDQFLCMAFAQLTYRESLRDIVACLRSQEHRLYHLGIRGTVSRSTLADANEARDWRIYADFAQILIREARALYLHDDLGLDLANTVYALDSTTIDLCMTLFPWARYKSTQHALKLHTLLDLRGHIPTFLRITAAQMHDVNILDLLTPEAGAFYVMDRGYLDFERLYRWTLQGAFFVTRARKNFRFTRLVSHAVDKSTGVQCDQTISLVWFYTAKSYPARLRRIRYWDAERGRRLVFLTNNFTLPALTIAELYRRRWQIELFFKWIKQHLRIKAFYGTSENAVKTQIWIAVGSYLLVAIVRKRLNLPMNLYTMLQILSVSLFEKMPVNQAFLPNSPLSSESENPNQLRLLDF
ncbi:MAG TPA: IS4 family transposase [Terriglobales bacterium]|nr:IS4 family transposase [Terriglobales bacterium]